MFDTLPSHEYLMKMFSCVGGCPVCTCSMSSVLINGWSRISDAQYVE